MVCLLGHTIDKIQVHNYIIIFSILNIQSIFYVYLHGNIVLEENHIFEQKPNTFAKMRNNIT